MLPSDSEGFPIATVEQQTAKWDAPFDGSVIEPFEDVCQQQPTLAFLLNWSKAPGCFREKDVVTPSSGFGRNLNGDRQLTSSKIAVLDAIGVRTDALGGFRVLRTHPVIAISRNWVWIVFSDMQGRKRKRSQTYAFWMRKMMTLTTTRMRGWRSHGREVRLFYLLYTLYYRVFHPWLKLIQDSSCLLACEAGCLYFLSKIRGTQRATIELNTLGFLLSQAKETYASFLQLFIPDPAATANRTQRFVR